MFFHNIIVALSAISVARSIAVGHSSGDATSKQDQMARETLQEAAVHTKQLVHSAVTGTLASVYPSNASLAGRPYAIMEYHAPCHPPPSLTFLLFPISLSAHNILGSEDQYAAYTVSDPVDGVRSPVSRGRVAFTGNITLLPDLPALERKDLAACYKKYHPDTWWFPGPVAHHPFDAVWARFDPVDIYYVGGFGDTHYIGHIPVDMYARAGEEDEDDEARGPQGGKGLVVQT